MKEYKIGDVVRFKTEAELILEYGVDGEDETIMTSIPIYRGHMDQACGKEHKIHSISKTGSISIGTSYFYPLDIIEGSKMIPSKITDNQLIGALEACEARHPGRRIRAWMIRDEVKAQTSEDLDESTIRGRFIAMNRPLSNNGKQSTGVIEQTKQKETVFDIDEQLKKFIPEESEFAGYVQRNTDNMLAVAYDCAKHPITQGKQGTGKTYAHMKYAFDKKLPFFLFSCHEDMKLQKLYGDKTIKNGSVEFQESIFVRATQSPSVILFDEVNAVNTKQTFDWHALLQNRELFIKDANGGGKIFKLHKECRIGFAQNPKSSKYIGGNILPSNFLGRCTFITFPDFTKDELINAMTGKYPAIPKKVVAPFVLYYIKLNEMIDRAGLPVDISIRQLINIIDMHKNGLSLKDALEVGVINMLDAVSQSSSKDALVKLSQGVWKELLPVEMQTTAKKTAKNVNFNMLIMDVLTRYTKED